MSRAALRRPAAPARDSMIILSERIGTVPVPTRKP
jgi:hypothetical protein